MQPSTNFPLPQVIDSTIRSEYAGCHTKGFYSFQANLCSPEPSTDLIAGGAFAKGLEVTRKLFYGSARLPFQQALEAGMRAAIVEYGEHVPPPIATKQNKSVDRVVLALADYFNQYNPVKDELQPFMVRGEPCVEFTFSIPLPIDHPDTKQPFLYAGRFDMLGLWHDQLVVDDEKTTSQLGPTWVNKWTLRGQFTGYIWACQQYDYPVLGALVRGVSFLSKSFGHAQSHQIRAPWQIAQWYDQLLHDLDRMVRAYKEGWYDQNLDETCAGYSGCPFQKLCTSSEPEKWYSSYGTRTWNPLAKIPYEQPKIAHEVVSLPEGVF